MSRRDWTELVLLAAVWGAAFLFTRIAAPEFGPVPLIATRVSVAALFLLAILAAQGKLGRLRRQVGPLLLMGAFNTAIPFTLFAYATLHVPAGFASVLNGTVPLFSAVIALFWKLEPLPPMRIAGLLIGFLGVVILVLPKLSGTNDVLAVLAGLGAANLYGFSAHYSKRHFAGEDSLVVSAGTLLAASLMLLPAALVLWPREFPSSIAWSKAIALGLFCTALAYLIYFNLLARVGAMKSVTVTYLIPPFGMLWCYLVLGEAFTWNTVMGCAVIVFGTVLVVRSQQRTTANATTPGDGRK
jgi:drug/metabolite transporter (DMT)-like permease